MYSETYLQAARQELARLKHERAVLEREIESLERHLTGVTETEIVRRSEKLPTRSSNLKDHIATIFQEEGRPLHYIEVYERLRDRGIPVPGKDPARNVGAHLSSDLRFQKLGAGRWQLAEKETKSAEDGSSSAESDDSDTGKSSQSVTPLWVQRTPREIESANHKRVGFVR